jgi:transposase
MRVSAAGLRVLPLLLADPQWAILEPLLPAPGNTAGRGGRPEKHSRRLILDAIFYLVRAGSRGGNCRSDSRRRPPSTTGSA